jgi:hypothetical protein
MGRAHQRALARAQLVRPAQPLCRRRRRPGRCRGRSQRSGDAIAVDGIIQTGDDCYIAIDGDIDITRNDQETELTLVSERTIEFIDETGDEEGDLTISITMTECEPLSEEVEATVSPS